MLSLQLRCINTLFKDPKDIILKKSLKKHRNNPQNLINDDYLAGCRISDSLPMVYEGGFSRKKMNEWFYNYTINKDLWLEEIIACQNL